MTTIDWIIVALVALLAMYGYLQGFLVGILSLVGFAAGAVVGTRLGPELLPQGSSSPYAPLFGLAGALLAGGVLASGLEGLGMHLRRRMTIPAIGVLDGMLGAALSGCVALGIIWILGAVALQTPGARDLRGDIQRSAILQRLNKLLPPSGPILNALARFDPVPRITGPPADVGPPPPAIARAAGVRAAADSVVRVLGTACGLGIEGSGWVAGPGVVVTNAHVVAGEDDTTVQARGRGPHLQAHAIRFDPRNDIAVLRVDGLREPALSLAPVARTGTPGAILGFPNDGPYDVEAGRIGTTETAVSEDAYGHGPVNRSITSFRGLVREGNSGGPLVDSGGRVLTTVFAATVGGAQPGGYGVPVKVVSDELASAGRRVGTGPCAS